jgi:hypothetical protein
LTPNQEQTATAARAVECDVTAHAQRCVPVEALADLRRQPAPLGDSALPPNFLKHSDEQCVAGLSAVYHAIHDHSLHKTDFSRWGVLAAPRFAGRPHLVSAIKRFMAEGSWGVSPHLVPHRSLHSLSGTISQALKIRGPNFGVGGGHSGAEEVIFTAVALLERKQLPGVWVVLTALDPEAALDDNGNGPPGKTVRALALALTAAQPGWHGLRLRLEMDDTVMPAARPDFLRLFTMMEQIGREREPGKSRTLPWQNCARLTLAWTTETTETRNAERGTRNAPNPALRTPSSAFRALGTPAEIPR